MESHFKYFLVLYVMLNLQGQYWVFGEPQVPCYFIFGDSLSDNGNNNLLPTLAKANYRPYGIDFPNKTPTGRFTNGRNMVDFIADYLGFENYIPPFASIKRNYIPPFKNNRTGFNILQGVNYASGAAGIRKETGQALGAVISLDQQLRNHNYTISVINGLLGNNESATTALLKSCLYMVEMGSNDYLNNYFRSFPYTTSTQFSPQQYAMALNQQLSSQLKSLYGEGARKFAVFGVGILGCTPYARETFDTQGSQCVDKINNAVQLFNIGLKSLVQDLNAKFTDAKFTFIDIFQISSVGPSNQSSQISSQLAASNQGQMVSDAPCCQLGLDRMQCTPLGRVCSNRDIYSFWDGVHPTEVGHMTLASRSYNAQYPNDTVPLDISGLAQLSLP